MESMLRPRTRSHPLIVLHELITTRTNRLRIALIRLHILHLRTRLPSPSPWIPSHADEDGAEDDDN
jgi:hypothetical protein